MLEVASGSGEHAAHFAKALPDLTFQPSDPSPEALASIAAWTAETGTPNLRPPLLLNASATDWPLASADAVLCINMIHIAPWQAAQGLIAGAAQRFCPQEPRSTSTAPIAAPAANWNPETPPSTPPCASATRNGACAISKP